MVSPKDVQTSWGVAYVGGGGGTALQVHLTVTGLFPCVSDGGTAWLSQESVDIDETDSGAGVKWKNVARQLKEDLSSIILLSEEDLQVSLPHGPRPRGWPLPPSALS